MNRNIVLIAVVVLVLAAGYFAFTKSQEQNTQQQTATPAAEDEGKDRAVYTGTTPCADCPGIDVKLSLKDSNKYKMTSTYQERNVEPLVEKGAWVEETKDVPGNPGATVLTLTSDDNKKTYFLVTQNGISQLNENMQAVTNPYALNLEKKK